MMFPSASGVEKPAAPMEPTIENCASVFKQYFFNLEKRLDAAK